VMKAPLGLGRNDVIRAVALVAIVVFPLIAHAQLGRSAGAVKTSPDVSPVAGAAAGTAAVKRDSCADQHWPFFSTGCLRESTQATGDAPKPARAAGIVRDADIVRDNGSSAGPKKPAKPRIAAYRRERKMPSINYAVNLEANHTLMPGW
jgi:hypothetical protein